MLLSACLLAVLPGAAFAQHPTALGPTADGKLLFVAMSTGLKDAPGYVCVWDLTKPELRAVVPGIPSDATLVRPTPDGKRFLLGVGSGWGPWADPRVTRVEVWDVAERKRLRAFELDPKETGSFVASPDGKWVAAVSGRGTGTDPRRGRVWNADTGEFAEEVSKAATEAGGSVAFTPDSGRLAVARPAAYAEFDLATGKKVGGWQRDPEEAPKGVPPERPERGWVAVLAGAKGVVTVAPTGKRRQSYVVRLRTEKEDWFLGEFWDFATPAVASPDGRLLLLGGGTRDAAAVFALKLDSDGAPELTDTPEKGAPFATARGKEFVAWRAWPIGEASAAGREPPGPVAFSPDGKRLFAGGRLGTVRVFDADRRGLTATLFSAWPKKDGLPEWYILTPAGAVVGSEGEVEALVKGGKVRDPAKVKDALGVK